jgi:hypothetical protein
VEVKMDLREIGWGGIDWIHLAQSSDQWRALVNTVINLHYYVSDLNVTTMSMFIGISVYNWLISVALVICHK